MCSIFARLFGWERVGAEDSFFGLGGHSLLAARLVAQIRAEFGVELNVRAVFDTPTPAGLAAQLVEQFRAEFDIDLDAMDAGDADGGDGDLGAFNGFEGFDAFDATVPAPASNRPQLVESVRPERLPLSYSQLATWFQYRIEGARDGFNMPFALRFSGPLDTVALTKALNDVVARHEALRTNFAEHEGVPYQQCTRAGRSNCRSRDRRRPGRRDGGRLRRHVFTPESGPLIRATLLALDARYARAARARPPHRQ